MLERGKRRERRTGTSQVHHAVVSSREEFFMLGGLIQQDQLGPDGVVSSTANKAHRILSFRMVKKTKKSQSLKFSCFEQMRAMPEQS